MERIRRKLNHWEYTLLTFHCRATIINTFSIPCIIFAFPFLHMSKTSWNVFLRPIIKEFLWRNKILFARMWQWENWDDIAKTKEQGGLGILDPITHQVALCAKLFYFLDTSEESPASMVARAMVMEAPMKSRGVLGLALISTNDCFSHLDLVLNLGALQEC